MFCFYVFLSTVIIFTRVQIVLCREGVQKQVGACLLKWNKRWSFLNLTRGKICSLHPCKNNDNYGLPLTYSDCVTFSGSPWPCFIDGCLLARHEPRLHWGITTPTYRLTTPTSGRMPSRHIPTYTMPTFYSTSAQLITWSQLYPACITPVLWHPPPVTSTPSVVHCINYYTLSYTSSHT